MSKTPKPTMYDQHVKAMRPVLEKRHASSQRAILRKLQAALRAGEDVETAVKEAASDVYWQGVRDGLDLTLPDPDETLETA
jgi:hypothetical protein